MSEHIPVLFEQVMECFAQAPGPVERYLDLTFGRGGHLRGVLKLFPEIEVVAVDQDHEAIAAAERDFAAEVARGQIKLVHEKFWRLPVAELGVFDLMMADLGVSSPQLDEAARGFSFYQAGPLDMRMDSRDELTAADIVNTWSEDELGELFRNLGEIRRPLRVVRAIIEARAERSFVNTTDLSDLIVKCEGWSRRGHHPATRYFLALRLAVNHELEHLSAAIQDWLELLNRGGRLAVITFHSLEDRIVKQAFKQALSHGKLVNKKVIAPSWPEQKKNARARSAKLRVFEKANESAMQKPHEEKTKS